MPAPLVALATAIAAFLLPKRERAMAVACAAVALATIVIENRRLLATAPRVEGVRILHWNVYGAPDVAEVVSRIDPDVLCISEPHREAHSFEGESWREGPLLLVARRGIERRGIFRGDGLKALRARVEGLELLFVDVIANPKRARWRAHGSLREQWPTPAPDVIVGDLITPAGAWSLRANYPGYVDGYLLAGEGLGYTWPSFVPLMKIDHVLVRSGLAASYRTGFSRVSDHRWQEVVVARPR